MSVTARGLSLAATLLAVFVLPWVIPALASLALALWVPLAPLSTGLLFDALYYAPHAARIPWGTVLGLSVTILAYLVRGRLAAGIIA